MPSRSSLEIEIASWLVELIKNEKLLDAIENQGEIDSASEAIDRQVGVPAFGFDHLSRRANVRAAATVLSNFSLLEILAVDKSISLTTGEVLRPDILCFNPKSRTLVVFEVKRDKLTERQALTELAGYEQELRNALPFLGTFDVSFVLVSTQWDVLLTHAVANINTWSGKNCLALKVAAEQRPFTLTCNLPNAWQLRGGTKLPDQALQTVDLFLCEDVEDDQEGDDLSIPPELLTAISIIARSGDRFESHGFVMLWRDHAQLSNGSWALTLCAIDPIAMYCWCSEQGLAVRPSKLTEYLDKHAKDGPFEVPGSLFKIARNSFPVLRGKYRPEFETCVSWEEKMSLLRRRASPVYFEFWGSLGDYARDFVCHSDVRERYMPFIDLHGLDWNYPNVAIPLLGNIRGDIPFPHGTVRCSDAFTAGIKLGLHETLAIIAEQSEKEARKLAPLVAWTSLEALRVAIEMAEIYRTSVEVTEAPPPLSSDPSKRASSATALCAWTLEHLIGDGHPVHQCCFEVGRRGAPYFSDWLTHSERQEYLDANGDALADLLVDMLTPVLRQARPFQPGGDSKRALRQFLQRLDISSATELDVDPPRISTISPAELLAAFRDCGAAGLDEVVPAVLHNVGVAPAYGFDSNGIKDSVRQIFESGFNWPAVLLSQNGQYGTGMVSDEFTAILAPIQDPEQEVYFCDQKAVASFWVKLTWAELQAKLSPPAT